MERMLAEKDFKGFKPVFFTTSQVGAKGPDVGIESGTLLDAYDLAKLAEQDILVTCQGGEYTTKVYKELRAKGFIGYWIDAASTLRHGKKFHNNPRPGEPGRHRRRAQNRHKGLHRRQLHGESHAHGHLRALPRRPRGVDILHDLPSRFRCRRQEHAGARRPDGRDPRIGSRNSSKTPSSAILEIDRGVSASIRSSSMPTENFGSAPRGEPDTLDRQARRRRPNQGRMERLCRDETRSSGLRRPFPWTALCVRIGAMRCHSQGLTIKLKKNTQRRGSYNKSSPPPTTG